jgi:hypothetical protein
VKRDEFDHAVRAAAAVLGATEVLVIGSQAIHGSVAGPLPLEAVRSVEVDVAAFDDPDGSKADLIDGSIGEASMFHSTFGFYAQGVVEGTAVLPDGWRDRLVRYEVGDDLVAWCLEMHDLWISKAVAGRRKDVEFCAALLRERLTDPAVLRRRLEATPGLAAEVEAQVGSMIDRYSEE